MDDELFNDLMEADQVFADLKVNIGKEPWYLKEIPEQITSIEELFGTLPNDIDAKSLRVHDI